MHMISKTSTETGTTRQEQKELTATTRKDKTQAVIKKEIFDRIPEVPRARNETKKAKTILGADSKYMNKTRPKNQTKKHRRSPLQSRGTAHTPSTQLHTCSNLAGQLPVLPAPPSVRATGPPGLSLPLVAPIPELGPASEKPGGSSSEGGGLP